MTAAFVIGKNVNGHAEQTAEAFWRLASQGTGWLPIAYMCIGAADLAARVGLRDESDVFYFLNRLAIELAYQK